MQVKMDVLNPKFLTIYIKILRKNLHSAGCASFCSTSEVMLKQVKSMAVQIMSVPASSRFPSQNRKQANARIILHTIFVVMVQR